MAESDAHHLPAPAPTNGNADTSAAVSGAGESLSLPFPGSKRQRRPSVRLGDIGDHSAAVPNEPSTRRTKHWKHSSAATVGDHPRLLLPLPKVSSHARAVAATLTGQDHREAAPKDLPPSSTATVATTEDRTLLPIDENPEPLAATIRRVRDAKSLKLTVKKMRSSLSSRTFKSSGRQMEDAELEEGYLEIDGFRAEDSESPSDMREAPEGPRVRVSENQDVGLAADSGERDVPFESEGGEGNDQNGYCVSREEGGVNSWLNRLGLCRYAPVFNIHEVDDEVLPLLTMEDLKDMGINAVGSRRKMYCAIQKLKKGFS